MKQLPSSPAPRGAPERGTALTLVGCGFLAVFVCGCTAFNPAFVDLFATSTGSPLVTLPNAPGHVAIALVNRATIDEQLLNFLKTKLPGLSDTQLAALRPRVRMRVRVTYIDGTFRILEFIDGSQNLIDPEFNAEAFPDLNQNDLNNAVVLCNVASVEVEPGTNIEAFIPVALQQYELVETTGPGGEVNPTFQRRDLIPPQFRPLQVDDVDDDGNVILQRNIGVRDVPSPTPNVICGSVVAIVVNGVLAVPFFPQAQTNEPSFDINDEPTTARIGGRYEFIVTVQ